MSRAYLDTEALFGEVVAAIEHSRALLPGGGERVVAGYALVTDDELSTLTYALVTRDVLAGSSDGDLVFQPTDWPGSVDDRLFWRASTMLREASEGTSSADLAKYVDLGFDCLVRALGEARRRCPFPDDAWLSVLSSDPCEHLSQLEDAAVRLLNRAPMIAAYDDFKLRWSVVR